VVIEFACEKCGRTLSGGESSAGHRVLCSKCGTFTEVPKQKSEPDDTPRPVFPEQGQPDETPQPPPPDSQVVPTFGSDVYDLAEPDEEEPLVAPPLVESGNPFADSPTLLEPSDNPYQSPMEYGNSVSMWSRSDDAGRMAMFSLALGLAGFPFLCCCLPFGSVTGIVGIVLGVKGLRSRDRGLAIAGIALCSIQVLWVLLALLFLLAGALG
jgi:hypothetical protein